MSAQQRSSPSAEEGPSNKKHKADAEMKRFFRSWAWKREHRPDKDRFQRPYKYILMVDGQSVTLTIQQQKFLAEGFASTVWDSSIVVAKYLEKWPVLVRGKRCLDLSAGCGLVAVVMAKLGAHVCATDLIPNLPLLQDNCRTNGVDDVEVAEHRWGTNTKDLQPPFDVIVGCDLLYADDLVPDLVKSLQLLSHRDSFILVAHGRNRSGEPAFNKAAAPYFSVSMVQCADLDEVYQCSDVDVLKLRSY
eukprot:GHRR01032922.1.p1 GENE.GHRR01032922.1~~GHRR01032922.1.p1  ORF type:complete len:247 (+),score=39.72 GHRR01032922.1:247-987(+)